VNDVSGTLPPKPTLQWNGRAVHFVEFDIRTLREVRAAYARSGEDGMWATLINSARYVDDDKPVFATIDEVLGQPARLMARLMRLAGEAAKTNGMEPEDADAPLA
jgi:hypothetical protein